ncbi:glycosyltransferase [Chryseobacterium viscerum]|uniref:Glycosyl transferase n=1 Tax=Chryseobacterium viscerum TaxID=1037377 RepID=A0A316WKQ4_9FLAO|nr:glycosyltransferase [Chryseobacterium viscerum]PWN61857.1 glycosyl transferase [Chryseobacterium viscerum]
MRKIFQISSEVNSGSVGRIAEQIGEQVLAKGWESYIAYARDNLPSKSNTIRIGNNLDIISHVLLTRLKDRHGFGSKRATLQLIDKIKKIEPDIIQLQHVHGYFINIEILFNFLAEYNVPVVWTFHDCWSFTGHCAHFELVGCQKWQLQCKECPQTFEYPKSYKDNSYQNYIDKKRLFNSIKNLTIVPVSNWLGEETKKSFLQNNHIEVIQNGIDIDTFFYKDSSLLKEKHLSSGKFVILGVASPWTEKKGLQYFVELAGKLNSDFQIILIGLSKNQIRKLPAHIIGLERTENVEELVGYYSLADVFVNPTLEDTFPTTNLEAQSCGTPVITFRSGGSPEAVNEKTGIVVEKGDLKGLITAIEQIKDNGKIFYSEHCRKRAEFLFDKKSKFTEYIKLYENILNK